MSYESEAASFSAEVQREAERGAEPRQACWCATIRAAGAAQNALCEPCKDRLVASLREQVEAARRVLNPNCAAEAALAEKDSELRQADLIIADVRRAHAVALAVQRSLRTERDTARIRELEAALGSSPDDTPCTCGTDDPTSARYQHEHLPWCAKGRP